MNYEMVRNNIRIYLHTETHEGWDGDYNPEDPNDQLLFRFDVDRLVDGNWEPIDDASYCTRLTADLPSNKVQRALEYLLDQIYPSASEGSFVKAVPIDEFNKNVKTGEFKIAS